MSAQRLMMIALAPTPMRTSLEKSIAVKFEALEPVCTPST